MALSLRTWFLPFKSKKISPLYANPKIYSTIHLLEVLQHHLLHGYSLFRGVKTSTSLNWAYIPFTAWCIHNQPSHMLSLHGVRTTSMDRVLSHWSSILILTKFIEYPDLSLFLCSRSSIGRPTSSEPSSILGHQGCRFCQRTRDTVMDTVAVPAMLDYCHSETVIFVWDPHWSMLMGELDNRLSWFWRISNAWSKFFRDSFHHASRMGSPYFGFLPGRGCLLVLFDMFDRSALCFFYFAFILSVIPFLSGP